MKRPWTQTPVVVFLVLGLSACVNFAFPLQDAYELQGPGIPDSTGRDGFLVDSEARVYPDSLQGLDPNYCVYESAGIRSLASSALLEAPSFEPDGELFASVAVLCEPVGAGPELAIRIEAALGTELRVRLLADWSGVLTLSHDGCRAGHVIACGFDELIEVLDSERHYLFLEAPEGGVIPTGVGGESADGAAGSDGAGGDASDPVDGAGGTAAYALQIALNHVGGYASCPLQREISASAFDALPLLADPAKGCYREALIVGDTRNAPDRFYVPCSTSGVLADPFGGAPDHAIRLGVDFPDGKARRAELRLDTGSEWDGSLSVSAEPCGAQEAIIDCSAGAGPVQRIDDLLLLPGAPVVAIIDGIGDHAPEGRAAGPYTLALRIYEDCL